MRHWFMLAAPLLLGACATIIEGTTQEITVATDPAGAECGLYREGARIGTIAGTPGSVVIKKTKHDISMLCVKQGYQQASLANRADTAGWVAGNILFGLLGGPIGVVVDAASGSGNKYDGAVRIALVPDPPDAPAMAAVLPASFVLPSAPAAEAPKCLVDPMRGPGHGCR